ncbi:MAG: biopolymer transporter ExbD [Candidatus Omnitrophica bacterium]|nr:biopolymer transporter ExbD [Candidatus Omnitrophota bacterium]
MKPPTTRGYLLTAESIALTDIVMNLFVFFFVSFSLLYTFSPERLARLEVALPKASTGAGGAQTAVVMTITRDGRYFFGDRPIPEGRIRAELVELAQRKPGVGILIRADEGAACRSLVTVFDACRAAGITSTSFAVQPVGRS